MLFIVGVWWCPPMIDNDSIFRLGNQDKLHEVACLCQCQVFASFQSSQRFQDQAFSKSLQHGVWRGTTGRVSLHPRWEIPSKNQPTYFSKHALHEWYFLSPMFSHRIRKGTELWGQWRRCTALELWESFGGPMFVVPDRWEPQFPSFEGHPAWKQKNPSWLWIYPNMCHLNPNIHNYIRSTWCYKSSRSHLQRCTWGEDAGHREVRSLYPPPGSRGCSCSCVHEASFWALHLHSPFHLLLKKVS